MSNRSKSRKNSKSKGKSQQRKPAQRSRPVFLPCRVDEYRSRTATGFNRLLASDCHVSRRLPDPLPNGKAEYVANWQLRQVA